MISNTSYYIRKINKLKDMGNKHVTAAAAVTGVSLAVALYSTYSSSQNKPAPNLD